MDAWLTDHHPQLAIVDLTLRDGAPTKAVQQMVQRNIPFIVHSGEMDRSAMPDLAFGAGTWLGKPSPSNELIATARKLAGLI